MLDFGLQYHFAVGGSLHTFPVFPSWPVMQGSWAFTLPVHQNETIDHPDAVGISASSPPPATEIGETHMRTWIASQPHHGAIPTNQRACLAS